MLLADDDVVMYRVKIVPCDKAYPHDFTTCPWLHPGERARRRDPRLVSYSSTLCPDVKKDKVCVRGASCPYSHNIFEYFLHPDRYRTRMCDFGERCTRKLCFFAHTAAQLRVTARSLAAQQAQANAGKGKASKGAAKQQQGGSSASTAGSNGSSGDLSSLSATTAYSPAAEQLLLALCANDGAALSGLLQKLGAAGEDASLDKATTAAIAALLQHSTLARSSSAPSDSAMQPAGDAADASQGSSPRTLVQQTPTLPPEAAAAQRKDTAPMHTSTAAANAGGSSTGSCICSVQEHIRNVMQGKVTAEQVQRGSAARVLPASAQRAPAMQLPGLVPPAQSPGVHALLSPMQQGPSLDLLSPGMQNFLLDGQLCSPQFLPVVGVLGHNSNNSGGMVVSCAGPAQLQGPAGFAAGDLGAMSGSAISSYGSGCILQTAASMDAAGYGSGAAHMSGSQCSVMGAAAGLEGLPPVLLQQLSLQGQGAAVGPGGNLIPLMGASSLPALGSPGQLPALSAAMPQYAQQQAAVLMQQQQATADGLWSMGRQGVSSMLGGGAGAGLGMGAPTFTPCLLGLSG